MTTESDTTEIRPNKLVKGFLFVLLDACLVGGSIFLFLVPGVFPKLVGLVGLFFFGVGGVWALTRMLRMRGPRWILSPHGLVCCAVPGRVTIPWREIEEVGIVNIGSHKMAALRLASYDGYLSSLTPEGAAYVSRGMKFLRASAVATSLIGAHPELLEFAEKRTAAECLAWARQQYGFEVVFSWFELDRSRKDFVTLLQSYLERYGTRRIGTEGESDGDVS